MWFYFFLGPSIHTICFVRSLAVQCDKMLDHFRLRHGEPPGIMIHDH